MRCSLPPHRETLSFVSHEDYEIHYAKIHTNRCSECGKNFPTGHFLGLHIEENHNPLREALQERGEKTYGCFVEDCERKCSTPQKRRMHLIDKHMFPRTYNFHIVNDGIDKHRSMLGSGQAHRRRISTHNEPQDQRRRRRVSQLTDMGSSAPQGRGKESKTDENQSEEEEEGEDEETVEADPNAPEGQPKPDYPQLTLNLKDTGKPSNATKTIPHPTTSLPSDSVADLEKSMSALQFVPTSVTLNRTKKKG